MKPYNINSERLITVTKTTNFYKNSNWLKVVNYFQECSIINFSPSYMWHGPKKSLNHIISWVSWWTWIWSIVAKGHTFIKNILKIFEKLLFLPLWYTHVRVRIGGQEMLAFRKTLRTYQMNGPKAAIYITPKFLVYTYKFQHQNSNLCSLGTYWY